MPPGVEHHGSPHTAIGDRVQPPSERFDLRGGEVRLQPVAVFNASYSSGVSVTMKTMRVRSNGERCESRNFQI
jgi:hypothetical protein